MIGIYKFENLINHKKYIGQSVDIERRYKDHLNRAKNYFPSNSEYNSSLHCAIRKYGIENFSFSILEECEKKKLNEQEIYWIKFYNSYAEGYNETTGGNLNQEASRKFEENFVNMIKELLLNSNLTYNEIHSQYGISLGRISEINTGKIWFDSKLQYPLRQKKKQEIKQQNLIKNKQISCPVERVKLKSLIRSVPFTKIGEQFKVTDNAVRKWCDKYNLPRTKKEIQKYNDQEWKLL